MKNSIIDGKSNYLLLLCYFLFTLFLYRNTTEAGLVFDFNGWANVYNEHSFVDVLNSFGYPGLHQLEHLFFYIFYKLFGFNGTAWYITFAFLHALTAITGFRLIKELVAYTRLASNYNYLPFLASFLFLSSPFAADVIVSKVTVHYFLSTIFIFSSLRLFLLYIENKEKRKLIASVIYFGLSLFCLEIAYAIPLMVIFILIFHQTFLSKFTSRRLLFTGGSFLILFIAFLLLHRIVVGSFIGHYGTEVHTRFVIGEMFANLSYYLNNYLFFFDFWEYKYKLLQMDIVESYWPLFLIALLTIPVLAYVLKDRFNGMFKQLFLIGGMFVLALAPIINMYCVTLQTIEADRYSYLSSIFAYTGIVFIICSIKHWLRIVPLLIYLAFHFYFLGQNIESFTEMGEVSHALIQDFRWEDKDHIIILVQPENNNGARSFTTISKEGSEFAESLFLERGIDIRDKVELIYEMNINSVNDSVKIDYINDKRIKVEVGWWGSWFWKYHLGAQSFETDDYQVKLINGTSFELNLNEALDDTSVMIYMHGKEWREVKI